MSCGEYQPTVISGTQRPLLCQDLSRNLSTGDWSTVSGMTPEVSLGWEMDKLDVANSLGPTDMRIAGTWTQGDRTTPTLYETMHSLLFEWPVLTVATGLEDSF